VTDPQAAGRILIAAFIKGDPSDEGPFLHF
jgi:hypothetical protein